VQIERRRQDLRVDLYGIDLMGRGWRQALGLTGKQSRIRRIHNFGERFERRPGIRAKAVV